MLRTKNPQPRVINYLNNMKKLVKKIKKVKTLKPKKQEIVFNGVSIENIDGENYQVVKNEKGEIISKGLI